MTRRTLRRQGSRALRRSLTIEALEARLALSGQSVFAGSGLAPLAPARYPDGLNNLDPGVRAAIAAVTTTAPADAYVTLADAQLPPLARANFPSTSLVEATSLIGLNEFRADPRFQGIDGYGYSVVILDTGIDPDHPFFGPDDDNNGVADRIVYQHDFVDGDSDASDQNGHGTHVSSIVASQDATYTGVAPGANIIHLRVLNEVGSGTAAMLESALQWVVAHVSQYNIASVNLSLGFGDNVASPTSRPELGLSDELAALAAQDVIVASASGNDFFTFRSQPGVSYPSSDPSSLSIGAVWDSNVGGPITWSSGVVDFSTDRDRIVSFSQRDPIMTTVFAPGAFITAAANGGGVTTISGTSMASPIVAGVAALAQQLAVQTTGHRLSLAEFRQLLKQTGLPIFDGDDEDDNVTNTQQQYHRLDVMALANAIVSGGLSDLSIVGQPSLESPTAHAGGVARVSFRAANQGASSAGPFSTGFYLSTDSTIDSSDRFLGNLPGDLLPGQSQNHSNLAVQIPADVTPGTYYLGIVLDDAATVAEGNEGNNVAVLPITVAADGPEIWVLDVDAGITVHDGVSEFEFGATEHGPANISKTFRVTNDGSTALTLGTLQLPVGFIAAGFPASVAPLTSVEFTISLDASSAPSAYAGIASFTSNDGDESPFEFSLAGVVDLQDEQGDDAPSAAPVSVPVDVESKIQAGGDVDWFRFEAVGGISYHFEVALQTLPDSVIRIIGPDGTSQLVTDDDGGVGLGSLLAWTAPADGAYFLEVLGKGVQSGTYRLTISTGDDHGSLASAATPTSDPSSNHGVLETFGDVDWFSFHALAGVQYHLQTTLASLADSVLRVIGIDGTTELAFNDDGAGVGPASLIDWTAPKDGTYYVVVEAKLPTMIGGYSLAITGVDDFGDNAPNAAPVAVPATQHGAINEPFDVDWFSFAALQGAHYEFVASLGTLSDSALRLIGPDGVTELAFDDDGGPGLGSLIDWTAPAGGTYYLAVSGFQLHTGTYDLSLAVFDDHGNNAATATAITDPSTHHGMMETSGDVDWYSFQALAGVSYRFETTLGSLSDATMHLIASDGLSVIATAASEPVLTSIIEWTAPSDGTFYVEVAAPLGSTLGDYEFSITGDDDFGDSPQNASALTLTQPADGVVERSGDVDWFSLAAIAGVRYRIEFELGTLAGAAVRVFESDGVTEVTPSFSGTEPSALIEWAATYDGLYFIEVGGAPPSVVSSLASASFLSPGGGSIRSYRLTPRVASGIPGDYDSNGNVDGFDFLVWQRSFGTGAVASNVPLDSHGFESYTPSALHGQHGWQQLGPPASSAIVQPAGAAPDGQAIQVTRADQSPGDPIPDAWWGVPLGAAAATGPVVLVQWDMRVTANGAENDALGPFFGVQAYDDDGVFGLLGSLGVDATTMDVLYQSHGDGYFVETGVRVTPDAWNEFAILFDFGHDQYTIYLEGHPLATTGFVDSGLDLNQLTDADFAALAVQGDAASRAIGGTAYFDNFRIINGVQGDSLPADGNGDGVVDGLDLQVWRDRFGLQIGSTVGAAAVMSSLESASLAPPLRSALAGSVVESALAASPVVSTDYAALAQWATNGAETGSLPGVGLGKWPLGVRLASLLDRAHEDFAQSPGESEFTRVSHDGGNGKNVAPADCDDQNADDIGQIESDLDAALAELFA